MCIAEGNTQHRLRTPPTHTKKDLAPPPFPFLSFSLFVQPNYIRVAIKVPGMNTTEPKLVCAAFCSIPPSLGLPATPSCSPTTEPGRGAIRVMAARRN